MTSPYITEVINKLFECSTSPIPDQSPAVECAVVLRGGKELMGALSQHPAGGCWGLKMLVPVALEPGNASMMEVFFAYEDVIAIGVRREIKASRPRIVT